MSSKKISETSMPDSLKKYLIALQNYGMELTDKSFGRNAEAYILIALAEQVRKLEENKRPVYPQAQHQEALNKFAEDSVWDGEGP